MIYSLQTLILCPLSVYISPTQVYSHNAVAIQLTKGKGCRSIIPKYTISTLPIKSPSLQIPQSLLLLYVLSPLYA